jgi:hypothetical protein
VETYIHAAYVKYRSRSSAAFSAEGKYQCKFRRRSFTMSTDGRLRGARGKGQRAAELQDIRRQDFAEVMSAVMS